MLFGKFEPVPDAIEFLLRCGNSPLSLLLECVQDINPCLESHRVNGPKCITIVTSHYFKDTRAEAPEWFGVVMPKTILRLVDCEAHSVLHCVGKLLQIRLARTNPLNWFHRYTIYSAL